MARILKAKYYAGGSFLSAEIRSNPSFTWRSLIEGRTVLNKGLLWRVGNRENINIGDPWVPNMPGFKVQVREGTPMRINKVNDLLLHNPKGWNWELIERVFDLYEADIIQQMPLA